MGQQNFLKKNGIYYTSKSLAKTMIDCLNIDYTKSKSIEELTIQDLVEVKNKLSEYKNKVNDITSEKNEVEENYRYEAQLLNVLASNVSNVSNVSNELKKTSPNGKSVDHIENLIFACRNCNQAKKEFDTSKIIDIVHPDGENIKKVFERDQYYKIVISQEYLNNEKVKLFYSKMKFDYAYRKLDYLLLNLYFSKNNKTDRIYNRLLELRNSFPSLNKLK